MNPAVTVSMWALGKCSYTEAFVRIAGQMGGGLVAFPLFQAISDHFSLTPFGGPEFSKENNADAFIEEFCATFLLMWAIYIVRLCGTWCRVTSCRVYTQRTCLALLGPLPLQLNWEFHFGKFHYIIKQTLTAVAIRALIEAFPTAGPAMNPMLATAWDAFGVGQTFVLPMDNEHYFVYWAAPCLAGILAAVVYAIYDGDKVFGVSMPIGPLKSKKLKKE